MIRDIRGVVLEKMGHLIGFGSAAMFEYVLTLRDGRGDPIRFPVSVVSATKVHEDADETRVTDDA